MLTAHWIMCEHGEFPASASIGCRYTQSRDYGAVVGRPGTDDNVRMVRIFAHHDGLPDDKIAADKDEINPVGVVLAR